jgi:hypothetical protein
MTDQQITFKWPMATQFTPESFDPTDDSEDWPTAPELYDNGYNLHRERMKYKTGGYYGSFQSDIHLKKDGSYNIILHQQASQLPRCLEFMVLRDTYYPIPDKLASTSLSRCTNHPAIFSFVWSTPCFFKATIDILIIN